jgi:hypothetical protein
MLATARGRGGGCTHWSSCGDFGPESGTDGEFDNGVNATRSSCRDREGEGERGERGRPVGYVCTSGPVYLSSFSLANFLDFFSVPCTPTPAAFQIQSVSTSDKPNNAHEVSTSHFQ